MLGTDDTRSPRFAEEMRDCRSEGSAFITPISISMTFMPLDSAEFAAEFHAGRRLSQKWHQGAWMSIIAGELVSVFFIPRASTGVDAITRFPDCSCCCRGGGGGLRLPATGDVAGFFPRTIAAEVGITGERRR